MENLPSSITRIDLPSKLIAVGEQELPFSFFWTPVRLIVIYVLVSIHYLEFEFN
jgi:hypothetical protein